MSYTKFAVRGVATILIISLLAGFLGYAARVIMARNLALEEFGLFYAVFAFLSLLGIFKSFGFDKSLVKYIPEFISQKKNDLIKTSILYVAFTQIITNVIIIVIVYFLSDFLAVHYFKSAKAAIVLNWLAVAFFLDSFVQILKFTFQGFKEIGHFAGIDVVRMTLIVIITYTGFKLDYKLLSPIAAYIIVPIILIIIYGWVLIKRVFPEYSKSKFIRNKALIKEVSQYSIFILATTVGGMILGYTDTITLTYFSGLTSVALYSVALPTTRVLIYFPRAITSVLLPLTSELWSKNKKEMLANGIESLFKYSVIIMVPIVFMIFSFSELILGVFFGKNYLPASVTMKILSIGILFAPISGICNNFFSGIGKPKVSSIMVYTATLLNVATSLILVPLFNIIGAAISTSTGYLIMMLVGLTKMRDFIEIKIPIGVWTKTFLAGITFVMVIWLLKKALALNMWLETAILLATGSLVYAILLFLLKVISIKEMKEIYLRIVK